MHPTGWTLDGHFDRELHRVRNRRATGALHDAQRKGNLMTDPLPLIGEADEPLEELFCKLRDLERENGRLKEELRYVTPVEPFNGPMWLIYKDAHGKQHKQPWEDLGTGSLYDPYTEDDMEIVGWWTEDD